MLTTRFGSLQDFQKGGVEPIDDDPKNYVFSNLFEVAGRAAPYARTAIAKNFQYVIEAVRAEGTSGWYTCAHDEFALCMDGEVEVHLIKLSRPEDIAEVGSEGARRLADGMPEGRKMGRVIIRRGHMALLPKGSAYRFQAAHPSALAIQTLDGPETLHRWADICQTTAS